MDNTTFEKFSNSNNAIIWLENFERLCAFKDIDEEKKLQLFPLYLTENTLQWYSSLAEDSTDTWEHLKSAFKQRYQPHSAEKWNNINKLYQVKQNNDETVEDYLQRVQLLGNQVKKTFEETRDLMINGFLPDIKRRVIMKDPTTYDELLKTAKETQVLFPIRETQDDIRESLAELTNQVKSLTVASLQSAPSAQTFGQKRPPYQRPNQQRPEGPHQQRPYQQTNQQQRPHQQSSNATNQRQTYPCKSCGEYSHYRFNCRHKQATCYNCQKVGHIARACFSIKFSKPQ